MSQRNRTNRPQSSPEKIRVLKNQTKRDAIHQHSPSAKPNRDAIPRIWKSARRRQRMIENPFYYERTK